MVKVSGPMFSFDASGTLADTATFSKWKGRNYVRQRVIPTNPKTDSQVGIRQMIAFLTQAWANISAANKATWEASATQKLISPFNEYVGENAYDWRNGFWPSQDYDRTRDDTAPTLGSLTLAQSGRNIQVTQAITTLADGWSLTIHVSQTTGFEPSFSNCKKTIELPATGNAVTEIGPFDPGTYYVRTVPGTKKGKKGTPTAQQSITIT